MEFGLNFSRCHWGLLDWGLPFSCWVGDFYDFLRPSRQEVEFWISHCMLRCCLDDDDDDDAVICNV